MTRLMVAAVVPSSSARAPSRTGPDCSMRDRADDWDGVMSEPERARSWRWIRSRATRRSEASSTAADPLVRFDRGPHRSPLYQSAAHLQYS